MTSTTTPPAHHWTTGRNGQRWVGLPARVFVSDFDGEGYSLYVDGALSGTFGSQKDAIAHAEQRYTTVLAATPNQDGPLSRFVTDTHFVRAARR